MPPLRTLCLKWNSLSGPSRPAARTLILREITGTRFSFLCGGATVVVALVSKATSTIVALSSDISSTTLSFIGDGGSTEVVFSNDSSSSLKSHVSDGDSSIVAFVGDGGAVAAVESVGDEAVATVAHVGDSDAAVFLRDNFAFVCLCDSADAVLTFLRGGGAFDEGVSTAFLRDDATSVFLFLCVKMFVVSLG